MTAPILDAYQQRAAYAYARNIRNIPKRDYALECLQRMLRGEPWAVTTDRPDGLSYMGAQAVEMRLARFAQVIA
jgi:hypothetical protein